MATGADLTFRISAELGEVRAALASLRQQIAGITQGASGFDAVNDQLRETPRAARDAEQAVKRTATEQERAARQAARAQQRVAAEAAQAQRNAELPAREPGQPHTQRRAHQPLRDKNRPDRRRGMGQAQRMRQPADQQRPRQHGRGKTQPMRDGPATEAQRHQNTHIPCRQRPLRRAQHHICAGADSVPFDQRKGDGDQHDTQRDAQELQHDQHRHVGAQQRGELTSGL